MSLTLGKMSVVEYEAIFTKLFKYAAVFVAEEGEKCRMFQEGLNHQIKTKIRLHHFIHYPNLVQGALKAEEIEKDFASRRQGRGKRSAFSFIPGA